MDFDIFSPYEDYERITWLHARDMYGTVHKGFIRVNDPSKIFMLTTCKVKGERIERLDIDRTLDMDSESFCERCFGAL